MSAVRFNPRCGWCATHNADGRASCVNCGGPLGPVPGASAEPAPPAPRQVPGQFVARVTGRSRQFGGAFIALGGGMTLAFLGGAAFVPLMIAGAPITLLFVAVGGGIVWSAQKAAAQRVAVLRDGRVASGAVASVRRDNDGVWRLDYTFDVDGTARRGTIESADAEITRFEAGNPLQVVHLDGGAASDVWPPLG